MPDSAFTSTKDKAKLVLDNGANPNTQNRDGNTLLMLAARECNLDSLR